jgi:hypothetical protein
MRILAFGGLLATIALTICVGFVALLYQPLPVWGLVTVLSVAFYVAASNQTRPLLSPFPIALAGGAGFALSAILWLSAVQTNFSAPSISWAALLWAVVYMTVTWGLLLLGGTLLRATLGRRTQADAQRSLGSPKVR